MLNNELYKHYSKLINPKLFLNDGGGHGIYHTKRVLNLAMIISSSHNLSDVECKILALACCYHDIGRVHNETDDNHGELSAQKAVRLNLLENHGLSEREKETVLTLIRMHCLDDCLFDGDERTKLLYQILKDADGLDRVRYGDLNPKYLRLDKSKRLIPTACNLLLKIRA